MGKKKDLKRTPEGSALPAKVAKAEKALKKARKKAARAEKALEKARAEARREAQREAQREAEREAQRETRGETGTAGKAGTARPCLPKPECCVSKDRCRRCPIRMLKEGTLPEGMTVKKRVLVTADGKKVTKKQLQKVA